MASKSRREISASTNPVEVGEVVSWYGGVSVKVVELLTEEEAVREAPAFVETMKAVNRDPGGRIFFFESEAAPD